MLQLRRAPCDAVAVALQAVLLDGGAVAEKQGGGLKTPLEHDDTYTSTPVPIVHLRRAELFCRYKEMTGDYSGRMLHGRPHGQGQLTCDSGDVIVGQFAFGLPHGIAKRTFSDGSTYEGNWDRGSMSGSGTLQQANGDRYDGMWFRGLRSSSGTQTWARPPTASGSATVRFDPLCMMLVLALADASSLPSQIRRPVGRGYDAR